MNRRDFIKGTGAGLALGASGKRASAGDKRPNVLLIIVDQMRLPRWFPEDAALPAYEGLRREGMSFTNHFTSAVPCSPSRACLFTGLHMPQHGVVMNMPNPGLGVPGVSSLDPSFTTLGHIFKRAGYRTPYFGKWHLTLEEDYKEAGLSAYGFEVWTGPDRDGWPYEGLLRDGGFTNQSIKWLKENGSDGPWFLTLSLINPHDVMFYKRLDVSPAVVPNVCRDLPGNFDDDLSGKPGVQKDFQLTMQTVLGVGPDRPVRHWRHYVDFYYYLNRKVDAQVGRALAALDELGLADNTLVVFTSDHGEMAGSHQLQGKGPFVYHENNNVPLIFRWPGEIQAGAETSALSQNVDLYYTLPELAGVPVMDSRPPGKGLAPVIESGREVNDHALMCFGYPADAFQNAGLVGAMADLLDVEYGNNPAQIRAVFDGRYKFARYFDEGKDEQYELYDLEEDPLEMRNLAGDPNSVDLEGRMQGALRDLEKKEMSPL